MTRKLPIVAVLLAMTLSAPLFRSHSAEPRPILEADVVYGHKDGLALTMDLYRPESEANGAAVLFMVSGGWISKWAPPEQMKPFFRPFLDEGFTVFAVRHGSSPRYTIPEAVSDVRTAVRFVRRHADRFQIGADGLLRRYEDRFSERLADAKFRLSAEISSQRHSGHGARHTLTQGLIEEVRVHLGETAQMY